VQGGTKVPSQYGSSFLDTISMKTRFLWRAFRARFRDQSVELKAIQRRIQPGDVVCDIGANKGSYLFWLSRWVGHGKVFAFEPQERLAAYLRTMCGALNLANVTVEQKAVYSKSCDLVLHIPGDRLDSPGASVNEKISQTEACRSVTIPAISLDDYFSPETRISVLKIDVEGAERSVFEGAERILREHAPLLVFECENRHLDSGSVFDIFEHLKRFGYRGEFICRHTKLPLDRFNPDLHQRQVGARFWDQKDYCNNFIFSAR
jgi:FkbM family methyltransferase